MKGKKKAAQLTTKPKTQKAQPTLKQATPKHTRLAYVSPLRHSRSQIHEQQADAFPAKHQETFSRRSRRASSVLPSKHTKRLPTHLCRELESHLGTNSTKKATAPPLPSAPTQVKKLPLHLRRELKPWLYTETKEQQTLHNEFIEPLTQEGQWQTSHHTSESPRLHIVDENSVAEQQVEQVLQFTQPTQIQAQVKRINGQSKTLPKGKKPVSAIWQKAWKKQRRRGQLLSSQSLQSYETLLGCRLSSVYLHQDTQAAALCHQIKADAFTVGRHIFLGRSLQPKPYHKYPINLPSPQQQVSQTRPILKLDTLLLHELLHTHWHTANPNRRNLVFRKRTRNRKQQPRKKQATKHEHYQTFSTKKPPKGHLKMSWDKVAFVPDEPVLLERGVDLVEVFASTFTYAIIPKRYDQKIFHAALNYLRGVKFQVSSRLFFQKGKNIFKRRFVMDAGTVEGLVLFLEKLLFPQKKPKQKGEKLKKSKKLKIAGISRKTLALSSASNLFYDEIKLKQRGGKGHIPSWFDRTLFTNFISRHLDLLEDFRFFRDESLKDKKLTKFLQSAGRLLFRALMNELVVVYRIRIDSTLVNHPIYRMIFETKSPKKVSKILKKRNQQAYLRVFNLPIDTNVMSKFMYFVHKQPGLQKKILENQNAAQHHGRKIASLRRELLERFGRSYASHHYQFDKKRGTFQRSFETFTENPFPMQLHSFPKLRPPYFDAMLERPLHMRASIHFPDVFAGLNRGVLIWERIKVQSAPNPKAIKNALLDEQVAQEVTRNEPVEDLEDWLFEDVNVFHKQKKTPKNKKSEPSEKKAEKPNALHRYHQRRNQLKLSGKHLYGTNNKISTPGFNELIKKENTQRKGFLQRDGENVRHSMMKKFQRYSGRTLSLREALLIQNGTNPALSLLLTKMYMGLITADHYARMLGSFTLAFLDRMLGHYNERQIVFHSPGLYLLRATLLANNHKMDEKRRPPSVTVMPVYVQSARTMAQMRMALAQKQRIQQRRKRQKEQRRLEKLLKYYKKGSLPSKKRDFLLKQIRVLLDSAKGTGPKNTYEYLLREKRNALWELIDTKNQQKRARSKQTLDYLAKKKNYYQNKLKKLKAQLEDYEKHIQDRRRVTQVQVIAMGLESGITLRFPLDLSQQQPKQTIHSNSTSSTPSKQGELYQFRAHDFSGARVKKQDGLTYNSRRDAMISAVKRLLEYREYERSQVSILFPEQSGMPPFGPFRTDPKGKRILFQALETTSTVATIGLMAAATISGSTLPILFLVPTGVVGAIPSGSRLTESIQQKTFKPDLQFAMEIADLIGAAGTVGSFIGKWGRSASQLAKLRAQAQASFARSNGAKIGSHKVKAFGAAHMGLGVVQGSGKLLGVAGDISSILLLSKSTLDQLKHINPNWPPSVRRAYAIKILSNATLMAGVHASGFVARRAIDMNASEKAGRKLLRQAKKENKQRKKGGEEPLHHQEPQFSKQPESAEQLFQYDLPGYRKKVGLVQDGIAKNFESRLQRLLLGATGGKNLSPDARNMRRVKVYRASDASKRSQTMESGEVRVVHRTDKHGAVTHLELHIGEHATWADVQAHVGTLLDLLKKSGKWAKFKHRMMNHMGVEPSQDLRQRKGELVGELRKHHKMLAKAKSPSRRKQLKGIISSYQKELHSKGGQGPKGYIAASPKLAKVHDDGSVEMSRKVFEWYKAYSDDRDHDIEEVKFRTKMPGISRGELFGKRYKDLMNPSDGVFNTKLGNLILSERGAGHFLRELLARTPNTSKPLQQKLERMMVKMALKNPSMEGDWVILSNESLQKAFDYGMNFLQVRKALVYGSPYAAERRLSMEDFRLATLDTNNNRRRKPGPIMKWVWDMIFGLELNAMGAARFIKFVTLVMQDSSFTSKDQRKLMVLFRRLQRAVDRSSRPSRDDDVLQAREKLKAWRPENPAKDADLNAIKEALGRIADEYGSTGMSDRLISKGADIERLYTEVNNSDSGSDSAIKTLFDNLFGYIQEEGFTGAKELAVDVKGAKIALTGIDKIKEIIGALQGLSGEAKTTDDIKVSAIRKNIRKVLWPVVVKLFTEPVQLGLDAGASKEQIRYITIERLNKFIRGYYGTPLHFKYASDLNEVVSKALYLPGSFSQVRFKQNQLVRKSKSGQTIPVPKAFGGSGGLRPDHVIPHFKQMEFNAGNATILLPVDIGDTKGHTGAEFNPHDNTQTQAWLGKMGMIIERNADGNHTFQNLFGLNDEDAMARIKAAQPTLAAALELDMVKEKRNLSSYRLRLKIGDKYHILLRNHEFFLDEDGQVNPVAFQAILGLAPPDRGKLLIHIANAKGQTISLDLGNRNTVIGITKFAEKEATKQQVETCKSWLNGNIDTFSFTNLR